MGSFKDFSNLLPKAAVHTKFELILGQSWGLAKADRWLQEEKKFYHQFSIVKYSYLPIDTFKKYVEMHVT